jgi:hypothetical protein
MILSLARFTCSEISEKWNWWHVRLTLGLVENGTDRANPFPEHGKIHVRYVQLFCSLWGTMSCEGGSAVDSPKNYKIVTKSREELELLSWILMKDIFERERV